MYNASISQFYQTTTYIIMINYEFNPWDNWDYADYNETKENVEWDIIGEWKYRDGERDFYVRITDVDLTNETIELEYNLVNVEAGGIFYGEIKTLRTNGVVSRYFGENYEYCRYVEDPDHYPLIWIYTGKEEDYGSNGIGYGVMVNDYWLTRQ